MKTSYISWNTAVHKHMYIVIHTDAFRVTLLSHKAQFVLYNHLIECFHLHPQKTTFTDHYSEAASEECLCYIAKGRVSPGATEVYVGEVLPVPATLPSFSPGCSLISTDYLVQVQFFLRTNKFSPKPKNEVLNVFKTKWHKYLAQGHGLLRYVILERLRQPEYFAGEHVLRYRVCLLENVYRCFDF